MVRAIPIRILRQILLVIVGAEAFSFTEITRLSRRGHAAGRHSVDVDVDPAVDQTSVRSGQCPSLTPEAGKGRCPLPGGSDGALSHFVVPGDRLDPRQQKLILRCALVRGRTRPARSARREAGG